MMRNAGAVRKTQNRSLVQGAELSVREPGGVLPWYSLDVFEMDGLPRAIAVPASASSRLLPGLRQSQSIARQHNRSHFVACLLNFFAWLP